MKAQLKPNNYLVIVLSFSSVLGMLIAITVYLGWSRGSIAPPLNGAISAIALIFCPPFVLSVAFGPTLNPDLTLVLIAGTMAFANAILYAGVAAGLYYIVGMLRKRSRER